MPKLTSEQMSDLNSILREGYRSPIVFTEHVARAAVSGDSTARAIYERLREVDPSLPVLPGELGKKLDKP